MRRFWQFFLLAVTGVALMILSPPVIGSASEIPATGLDVNSAIIKDTKGKVYPHDVQLPKGDYTVNYQWKISNSTNVNAGDTMTLTLPSNVHVTEDEEFKLYNAVGASMGVAHMEKDNPIVVVTANNVMHNMINRRGWIRIGVEEKDMNPTKPTGPISMTKSASWADPTNKNLINWHLNVNHEGNTLTNPVIKDTFSGNQKYVAGSVKATDASGKSLPVTATTSLLSNTVTFKISGTIDSDIALTYQTRPKLTTGGDTFNNNATYTDDGGHKASANASIDREDEDTSQPENPGTGTPEPNEPIAMEKSVSWADPNDQTKLNWSIRINDNGNKLVNPEITDHLSANQSYVQGSAKMVTSLGDTVPITASPSGNGLTIVFKVTGTYTTNLHLTYQSKTSTTKGTEEFTNDATYKDDNDNNASATAEIDRTAEPELPNRNPVNMTKSVAWADPNDQTKLNWKLSVSANGNQLINPTIVDKISANQTFVAGSAEAKTITGEKIPVTASTNGTEITFKLSGTYTSDIQLSYQTTTDETNTAETFANGAIYDDEAGNHADASTSIDRDETEAPKPAITMAKTATWSDPADKTKIDWALNVTTNGNKLTNPVISDILSDNHSYVAGSVKVTDANGKTLPVTATVDGSEVTFKITGETTADLKITYQTTTKTATGAATFNNAAILDDQNNNHAEADAAIDREAQPVEPAKDPIEMTKTAAWSDPNDHNMINWQLKVATKGNTLLNPVISDQLSDNQTYRNGSAKAVDAAGNTVPVVVTTEGNKLTFKFSGTITNDLTLSYQTTTNEQSGAATFDNAAILDDDNDNHAEAESSIDRENPPVMPVKDPIEMSKVAAWSDSTDHTIINWTLSVKANGNDLSNPVITDILSDNQTYREGSARAVDDSGQELPLDVSVDGSTITFKIIGKFTADFRLTYQTKTNKASGAEIFANAAVYSDDDDNEASADTSIERDGEDEDDEPGTTEPGKPGTEEPENPGTTEPNEPGTEEPEKPGTTEPTEPGTEEPETPGTTEPGKPGTQEPEMPGTTEPSEPGTGEPETPGTTEPGEPGMEGPEMPGATEPSEPGTGEPEVPGITEPGEPGTSESEMPGTTEPSEPGMPETEMPGMPTTPYSSTQTPAPYSPASGRLPQTSEHQNNALATIVGFLILLLTFGLGYFDLRRHNM
ncbi:hypothetical protein MH1LPH_03600 [Lactiplantibacillus brownii]